MIGQSDSTQSHIKQIFRINALRLNRMNEVKMI